jgi:hypothetical protein
MSNTLHIWVFSSLRKKEIAVMWWWENQQKLLCKSFFQGTVPSKQAVK